MKNMNKRTKMMLAILGVLIVIVVGIVLVINQDLIGELSGTVITLNVEPASLTLDVGQTGKFTTGTILNNCLWTTSDANVVSISSQDVNYANVRANHSGVALITETCGRLGRYQGSANVRVVDPALRPTNP